MTEHKLSEQEIKQIDIEARDYAWINYDKDKGDWITFKTVYAAALTRERERVKEVESGIEILKELCQLKHYKDNVGKDAFYEKTQPELWAKANEFLNNYKNNK